MARPPIPAHSDQALNCYHQKLAWKIGKEDWDSDELLFLKLKTRIPGSSSIVPSMPGWPSPHLGGCVGITRGRKSIEFITQWPKDENHNRISLNAVFSINFDDGSSVRIKCDKISRTEHGRWNSVIATKRVNLDFELLFDAERCLTIEAELKVDPEGNNVEGSFKMSNFVKDIEGIFSDLKTADVEVISGNGKFHCHKNILSARCEVFKNMLGQNTLESESNTIEVKEAPAEAVESMLKYIYNGEIPGDPEKLSLDLLNLAEMYLLSHLKEACLKSLIERLDVSSSISTFIMADRYLPSGGGNLREVVIKFMKCKAGEVVDLEDWDKLVDNHPALAKELMRVIAKGSKEKHKCQFCVVSFDK